MYLVSNQAELPTVGHWLSTLRATGKSPTELSASLPSCWMAVQAWTGREESVQTGWAKPGNGPCHDGTCPCRELLDNTAEKPGPAAAAFTCWKNDGKSETCNHSCSKPKIHKAVLESPWDPVVQITSALPGVNVVHLHPAAGWLALWWIQYTLYEHVLHQADLPERLPLFLPFFFSPLG